jgi:hypothetical protein
MTGYDHEPVIRRNSLNGGKVLYSDLQGQDADRSPSTGPRRTEFLLECQELLRVVIPRPDSDQRLSTRNGILVFWIKGQELLTFSFKWPAGEVRNT